MIGQGCIAFKRGKDKNELHFTSPWQQIKPGDKEWEREVRAAAIKDKWKPDRIVDDAELEKIRTANRCIGDDGTPGYHPNASDWTVVIDWPGDVELVMEDFDRVLARLKEDKAKAKKDQNDTASKMTAFADEINLALAGYAYKLKIKPQYDLRGVQQVSVWITAEKPFGDEMMGKVKGLYEIDVAKYGLKFYDTEEMPDGGGPFDPQVLITYTGIQS